MKKPIKKPKHKSVASLKKQLWPIFSHYIRLRDCLRTQNDPDMGNCITCGRLVRRTQADAGHFIRREFNGTLFDETNVHLQCKLCNGYHGGEQLKYRREIIRLYGEGYDVELEGRAAPTKQFSIPELEELKENFKQKIKELEE